MLGNWSVDNYGKRETIEMALELLSIFGLDFQRLWVTIFGGDPELNLPPDEFTPGEWQRHGFPPERIVSLGLEDNFWDMGAGVPGPCGPCTEIFVDYGPERGCGRPDCRPGCSCERFLEIWNLVFIEFDRSAEGRLTRLPFLSIDTGMGLERIGMVLQEVSLVFDLDLFQPALEVLHTLAPCHESGDPALDQRARRVILDHTRAVLFACLEGVLPGPDGRGSVVRRLLRRAARQGRVLGLDGPFLLELVDPLLQAHAFMLTPEQLERVPQLMERIAREDQRFRRTLTIGLKILEQLQPDERGLIPGEAIFCLHSDRGFPSDLATEILTERGLTIDWSGYEQAFAQHRQVSRLSVESQFRSS